MRVSVIMPSYRHEAFIAQAIGSVLAQTVEDMELIVIDDASPDASNDIISGFKDRRILHIPLPTNVGACEAMNIGLRRASSPLIAVCNSDDAWEPHKLRRQLDVLERDPNLAAVFSDVSWMDARGQVISEDSCPLAGIFTRENRSRHAWLKRLVESGNCLCHPSVLIRRAAYETCGYYDPYLRQLPDYDMWLRLVQRHDIHVMPDKLIRFRVHDSNTSKSSPDAQRRNARESLFILRKLFDEISAENFNRAFLGEEPAPHMHAPEQGADPRAVLTYLCAYQKPRQHVFHDIMLERLYRTAPALREAFLPASVFQEFMAQPDPALMESVAPPPVARNRLRSALKAFFRNGTSHGQ